MGKHRSLSIPIVALGQHGLRVSREGLGRMGMSAFYGSDDGFVVGARY
jgi:hypothetical protein